MLKKNIIILDSWTAGIRNYDPIVKTLSSSFNFILVHNEKLTLRYLDKNVKNNTKNIFKSRETYNKYYYKICDISQYGYSINNLISKENPVALITISYHGIFQRWANLIFRHKGIPAFYLMHGITGAGFKSPRLSMKNVRRTISRLLFYGLMIILYMVDTKKSGYARPIKYWIGYIKELLFAHDTYSWESKFREDMKYNTAFIIQESDRDVLSKLFDKETDYIITGHMDNFYIYYDSDDVVKIKDDKIVMISQPLYDLIGVKKVLNVIGKLKIHCEKRSIKFIVKRHPNDDDDFLKLLGESNFTISSKNNLSEIKYTIGLVGFSSTLLLQAILMEIPILNFKHSSIESIDSITKYEKTFTYDLEAESENTIDLFIENCFNNKKESFDFKMIKNPVSVIENYFKDIFK